MPLVQTHNRLTEAEYLELERAAEFKSEFFDGEMFAMAGGTPNHALISANLVREVGNQLHGKPCRAYSSDLRIRVEATGLFTYPDLSVVCGPLELYARTDDVAVNPTMLAEVLSPSTEAYDRGKKSENYRRIPSLREYLLVSQTEPKIELYIRQENSQWLLQEIAGLQSSITLPHLRITLAAGRVYDGVEFPPFPLRALTPHPEH